jgi:hypothetical protein
MLGITKEKPAPPPAWIKRQLAKLVKEAPVGPDWLHEMKLDGYRMHARLDAGRAQILTRRGNDWTGKYPGIVKSIAGLPARSAAPTIAQSMRIMSKISATVRCSKAWTSTPCRTSAATISACRSEKLRLKLRLKLVFSSMIFGMSAEVKAVSRQAISDQKGVFGMPSLQCRHAAMVCGTPLTGVDDRAVID